MKPLVLIGLLLLATPAEAVVAALGPPNNPPGVTSTATITYAVTVPTGTDVVLAVNVVTRGAAPCNNAAPTVTYGGTAMTAVPGAMKLDADRRVTQFYLQSPIQGQSLEVVVTAAGTCMYIESNAQAFSGVESSGNPVGAVTASGPKNTQPSLTIATTVPGSVVIDQWWDGLATAQSGVGAGQLVIQSHATPTGIDWVMSSYKITTTAGVLPMSWTLNTVWGNIGSAWELKPRVPPPPPDPAVAGRWTQVETLPFFTVHTHLLPTGKVLVYPGAATSGDNAHSWDPATGAINPLPKAGWDLFCAGHVFLGDGRLLVVGGHIQTNVGLPNASTYDPFSNTWARHGNMNAGRWYPTVTTLANGDALVVSGSIDPTTGVNRLPQVFQSLTGTFRDLTSAQLGLALYPTMFLAPNGQVFNSGPGQTTRYLDTAGTGAWSIVGDRTFGVRDYGSAVMYDGRVLMMGGGDPPTATAEIIDLNAPSPAWRAVAPMAIVRRQLNATILADGSVLANGGNNGPGFDNANAPVYAAEIWDPTTETWTLVASASFPRRYHSSALLLPDGRVYTTGGDGYPEAEVYEPPYLFRGVRPSITSAPPSVAYGQTFFVGSPDASAIARVHWIRLSSVTHAFNQNQRLNTLAFTAGAGGLNVTAPGGGEIAPPGHYMLFLVDGNGVPSVAAIIQIGAAPPPPAPTVTGTAPVAGATGVSAGTSVSATFSQAMDAATINATTFLLRDAGGAPVSGSVTYSAGSWTATLTPGAPLAASTTYTATVRGGATDPRVKDTAGTALAADHVWSFTTAVPPPQTFTLTVSKAGSGKGTVTSSPGGIDCGGICSVAFPAQAAVTLTATPAPGSVFRGWTGVSCGSATTCVVIMTGNISVGARFQKGK